VARRLILDTGVIVAADRQQLKLQAVIGDGDPAISALTAMELLAGVDRASSTQRDLVALNAEALLAVMPIVDYAIGVARAHAHLMSHTRQKGRPRGTVDLLIAATACATGRTLLTTDAKAAFDELPGVRAEVVGVG
jgi:tRNA(fMet)-specific endonuclease VapC